MTIEHIQQYIFPVLLPVLYLAFFLFDQKNRRYLWGIFSYSVLVALLIVLPYYSSLWVTSAVFCVVGLGLMLISLFVFGIDRERYIRIMGKKVSVMNLFALFLTGTIVLASRPNVPSYIPSYILPILFISMERTLCAFHRRSKRKREERERKME
ncbi:MAG: hypothetical protein Q3998_02570 [Porphyromonas sp.]|nr:hypothetical protein [Porphyromonas sp.]